MTKIYYEVRFKYYHYNTGSGDNGTYTYNESFDDIEKAKQYKNIIDLAYIATKLEKHDSFSYKIGCEIIGGAGFVTSYATIFEITEKKL